MSIGYDGAFASMTFGAGMPLGMRNAPVPREMMMRVGIPHRGGKLAFHAFEHGYPAMVSAAAFWDHQTKVFKVPEATDLSELDFALDSAGFTAMLLWKQKGKQDGIGGFFPWQLGQYVELAAKLSPTWWSQPDMCCEPLIADQPTLVDYRVRATATLLEATLREVYQWHEALAEDGWAAEEIHRVLPPPVPVLQGWRVADYLQSLDLMLQIWDRWSPWVAPPALIGLGSVCRRSVAHREHGLLAILSGLEGKLPKNAQLHLFGIKGTALNQVKMLDFVGSCDSMAYDLGARLKAHRAAVSNTVAHRSQEMTRWMTKASKRLSPAPGDQFRLSFCGGGSVK